MPPPTNNVKNDETEILGIERTTVSNDQDVLLLQRVGGDDGQTITNDSDEPVALVTVTIPHDIKPEQTFQAYAGGRLVRVACPADKKPGDSFEIAVRLPPKTNPSTSTSATRILHPPSSVPGCCCYEVSIPEGVQEGQQFPVTIDGQQQILVVCPSSGGTDGKMKIQVPEPPPLTNEPTAFRIKVPLGVQGGEQFPITIQGRQINVRCPPNVQAGATVRIQVPPPSPKKQEQEEPTQLYEVVVPPGVQVGQTFLLRAGGLRVALNCPKGITEDKRRVRFKLPVVNREEAHGTTSKTEHSFEEMGWLRVAVGTPNGWSYKWMRQEDGIAVTAPNGESRAHCEMGSSAYARRLERNGASPSVTLVPASDVAFCAGIKSDLGERLVSFSELATAQLMTTAEDKAKRIHDMYASRLLVEGCVRIVIRRDGNLLADSVEAVMSMTKRDLRKPWLIDLVGKPGMLAESHHRWFELITAQLLDPDLGLWMIIETDQGGGVDINPAAAASEKHLQYFRCLGRVLGKALVSGEFVAQRSLAIHIYKHLLGWPVRFDDLAHVDAEYYRNLKRMKDMKDADEDVSIFCLDFTTIQRDSKGAVHEVELVEGGLYVDVTNENLEEYLKACFKYRMLERVKPQLTELLLGFFDVVPEPFMTILTPDDLELALCGQPEIDIEHWKQHTDYEGEFYQLEGNHPVCKCFWEIVENDFGSDNLQGLLLQFATGSQRPPRRVSDALQLDGRVLRFRLHGRPKDLFPYPRSHTSFHRIDLPMYDTKDELREKLRISITASTRGFDLEWEC